MSEQQIGSCRILLDGRRLAVDMTYPRSEGHVNQVEVGIEDIRAADSVLVEFDFERNGYSIKQASRFSFAVDEAIDPDWQEVAFVPAWARRREEDRP